MQQRFLFQSFVLMDMEGTPVQELAAIEVNRATHAIVDVFFQHAYTSETDSFSRCHVHGLSQSYLKKVGLPSEEALLSEFKTWLSKKPYVAIFANDCRKESLALGFDISDFKLAPWAERKNSASHQIALRFKELSIPVLHCSCSPSVHCHYVSAPFSANANSAIAKARHGYHCALYDVMELYFECIML